MVAGARWVGLCILVGLGAITSGCSRTQANWKHAQSTELRADVLRGFVIDRTESYPRIGWLVAAYVEPNRERSSIPAEKEEEFLVLIPVKEDGSLPWPFDYGGESNIRLWNDTPPDQRDALTAVRFGPQEFAEGARAVKSGDFVPLPPDPSHQSARRGAGWGVGQGPVAWFRLVSGSSRQSTTQPSMYLANNRVSDRILLLPSTQERPPEALQSSSAKAVLATPGTMAKDALDTIIHGPIILWWEITNQSW